MAGRLALRVVLALALLGLWASSALGATLAGSTTVLPSADSNTAGTAEAFRATATASGTLARIAVYVDSGTPAGTLVAGIYADAAGRPGALIAQGTRTSPAAGAWNDVTVSGGQLTSGTSYWIAVMSPTGAGTLRFRDRGPAGGGAAETSASTSLTTLPATWARGTVYKDGPLSAYAASADGAALVVTPGSLTFSAQAGGADPPAQMLAVTNGGTGSLSWTASANQPWLTVAPASGTAPSTTAVTASVAGLAAGTYTGAVTITAAGASGSPRSIGVTFTVAGAAPPDTTPPTVTLTAPAGGATVSGTTTLSATAADDVGVAGVQFQVDGTAIGAEDASAPYSLAWDSTQIANGQHTLTAVARDAAGNRTASAGVAVTVSNVTAPPTRVLLGNQAIEAAKDSNVAGVAEAFRATATSTGTLSRLSVYVDAGTPPTRLIAGVYADSGGHPGALLVQGSLASPAAGAWNDIPLPAAGVTSGTTYWVAVLGTGGTLRFRDRVNGGAAETASQSSLTALPATWVTGARYTDGALSAYGSGS
jgi:hypothetical protein